MLYCWCRYVANTIGATLWVDLSIEYITAEENKDMTLFITVLTSYVHMGKAVVRCVEGKPFSTGW